MSTLHAIILGIVQGLTEFLPISSSGHLQIVPWLLGWDDFADDEDLEKAFDVAVHLGTLLGVLAFLWRDVVKYMSAGFGMLLRRESTDDGRIAWILAFTIIPAAVVALLCDGIFDRMDDELWLTATTLIVFGVLLHRADQIVGTRETLTLGWRDAVVLGVAQAFALQPGVSRSGITITAARALKFERSAATRLAFLMSIPIIGGAGLFQFAAIGGLGGIPAGFRFAFICGMLASAFTGWIAVRALVRFVVRRDLSLFALYRVFLGLSVFAILATNWR